MVALVRSGRPVKELARQFKVRPGTIYRWVAQAEVDVGEREGLTTDEKSELARLGRENADPDRRILKMLAARGSHAAADLAPKIETAATAAG